MEYVVDAKIEGIREREPRIVYHGTSAGAIEMATRGGPPYELVSLGALIDKGMVPLGGEITRGGLTVKGVNQDRISTAESMERPLSYALGEHETRTSTSRAYMIEQHKEIRDVIHRMNEVSEDWPIRRMFYTSGLRFIVAMMRLRQMNPRGHRILDKKLKAWVKLGRLTHVPSYSAILHWFRGVVRTTLIPYQNLLDASEMTIEQVLRAFPRRGGRPISAERASSWSDNYGHIRKFIEELKTVPDNTLLLYAISLAEEEDTKTRMVKEVQDRLDRYTPVAERIIGLAERAFDFSTDVPFDARDFPFELMNIPVIVKCTVTPYTVNPDEISVYETIDLKEATVYYFEKDEDVLRERSSWTELYTTEHLYLESTEPQW
jgi:hypothetical protein